MTTPTASAGPVVPFQDVYARTARREARLRAKVLRAHLRHIEANGYDAALNELLKLSMGQEQGEHLNKRSRVQALRSYIASFHRVAGSGRTVDPEDAPATPPQIVINIGLPKVTEPPAKPAHLIDVKDARPALPPVPPAANGNGRAKEGT